MRWNVGGATVNLDYAHKESEMLVLTRMEGESILIGDDTRVTLLEIRGGQIRIGIEAPRDVPVMRSELLEEGAA